MNQVELVDKQKSLKERIRRGGEGEDLVTDVEIIQLVTFLLDEVEYGVNILSVHEILRIPEITRLPNTPGFIKGVINLRGEVVPVIDLSSRFYGIEGVISENTSIIIVEIAENEEKIPIGVMIDSVRAVTELSDESIESVPEIGNRIRLDYIDGIGKVDGEFAILLHIENVLKIEELSDFD